MRASDHSHAMEHSPEGPRQLHARPTCEACAEPIGVYEPCTSSFGEWRVTSLAAEPELADSRIRLWHLACAPPSFGRTREP